MAVEITSGVLEKVFVKAQTFGTFVAMVAGDSAHPVKGSFKLEPFVNFEKTKEAVGSASLQGEAKLDRGGKWSGSFYIRPGALGVAPDIGPLLKAAMGVETITGSTSSVYTLSDAVTLTPTATLGSALQFMHVVDGHWSQFASGAWVEQMVINVPGNGIPTIDFSGGFAQFGWCYRDDIAGGEATGQTEIGIDDASRGCVHEPAMCEFTGDDGSSNAGYIITGHDNTTGSAHFDINPAIQGAGLSGGAEILPFVLAGTAPSGTLLSAVECALTFGSISPGFTDAKITLETGIGPRDKEATTEYASAIGRIAERSVEADLSFYFTDTAAGFSPLVGYAHDGTTYDVDLRVGPNTAAKRMALSIPKGRLDIQQHDLGELIMCSGKIIARQSSTAADEFAISLL